MTNTQYEGFSRSHLAKHLRKRTLDGYIESLRRLRDIIGDKELQDYSPADVQKFALNSPFVV